MSDELFARPNKEARIHDLAQFVLVAPSPVKNRRSICRCGERNGAPRITFSLPTTEKNYMIAIGMSPAVCEMFLSDFEELILSGKTAQKKMENLINDPNASKDLSWEDSPKITKNFLRYGRLEDGYCFIAGEQPGAPKVVFRFNPSTWHTFYDESGNVVPVSELSTRYTLSFIRSFRRAIAQWTARVNPPWEPKEPGKQAVTAAAFSDVGESFTL